VKTLSSSRLVKTHLCPSLSLPLPHPFFFPRAASLRAPMAFFARAPRRIPRGAPRGTWRAPSRGPPAALPAAPWRALVWPLARDPRAASGALPVAPGSAAPRPPVVLPVAPGGNLVRPPVAPSRGPPRRIPCCPLAGPRRLARPRAPARPRVPWRRTPRVRARWPRAPATPARASAWPRVPPARTARSRARSAIARGDQTSV
jgi:hypothetical protein